MKANYGYKLRNKYEIHQASDRHGLEDLATVNKSDELKYKDSFTINKLTGPSLIEFQVYANELVQFLERVCII